MRRGGSRFGIATGGMVLFASLELTLRSLSDVVPLVDLAGTILSLAVPLVSDQSTLAWTVGWFFLATLAYNTYRRVDIIRGVSVSLRKYECFAAALVATAVGITVKQQIFTGAFGHGSIPSPFAENAVFLLLGAVGLRYALIRDRFGDDLLLAIVIGPAMAIAATLYPLPEVAVVVWVIGAIGVNTVPFGPQLEKVLNDPIERLMIGIAAAKSGTSGLVTSLYIFAGLIFSLAAIIDSSGTTRGNILTLVQSAVAGRQTGEFATTSLSADLFLFFSVFFPAIYGVWYWLRVVERLPFDLGFVTPSSAGNWIEEGDDGPQIDHLEYRAIPPGYGLPIALLYAPLIVHVNVFESGTEGIPLGYLAATVCAALVAIATVIATRRSSPAAQAVDVTRLAPKALALQAAVIVIASEGPVPQAVHSLLTLSSLGGIEGSVLSAVAVTAIVAGGVYVPSYIPTLLETNPTLGVSISAIVVGILIGLLGGGLQFFEAIGGLIMIAGILGSVFGLWEQIENFVASD